MQTSQYPQQTTFTALQNECRSQSRLPTLLNPGQTKDITFSIVHMQKTEDRSNGVCTSIHLFNPTTKFNKVLLLHPQEVHRRLQDCGINKKNKQKNKKMRSEPYGEKLVLNITVYDTFRQPPFSCLPSRVYTRHRCPI